MNFNASANAFGSVQLPCHREKGAWRADLTVGEGVVKTYNKIGNSQLGRYSARQVVTAVRQVAVYRQLYL